MSKDFKQVFEQEPTQENENGSSFETSSPPHLEIKVEPECSNDSSEYDSIFRHDYVKRTRKDKSYNIPKDISATSDDSYNSLIKNMAQDLYKETLALSVKSGRKAFLYKLFFILINLYIILASAVVSILALEKKNEQNISYIAAVISLTITTLGSLISTFSFEKKASKMKQYSLELRELSGKINLIQKSNISSSLLNSKLEKYINKVDKYSLLIFGSMFNTDELENKNDVSKSSSDEFVKDN